MINKMLVTVENMDTPFGSSERFAIQDEEGCRQWFHEEADENQCHWSSSQVVCGLQHSSSSFCINFEGQYICHVVRITRVDHTYMYMYSVYHSN